MILVFGEEHDSDMRLNLSCILEPCLRVIRLVLIVLPNRFSNCMDHGIIIAHPLCTRTTQKQPSNLSRSYTRLSLLSFRSLARRRRRTSIIFLLFPSSAIPTCHSKLTPISRLRLLVKRSRLSQPSLSHLMITPRRHALTDQIPLFSVYGHRTCKQLVLSDISVHLGWDTSRLPLLPSI